MYFLHFLYMVWPKSLYFILEPWRLLSLNIFRFSPKWFNLLFIHFLTIWFLYWISNKVSRRSAILFILFDILVVSYKAFNYISSFIIIKIYWLFSVLTNLPFPLLIIRLCSTFSRFWPPHFPSFLIYHQRLFVFFFLRMLCLACYRAASWSPRIWLFELICYFSHGHVVKKILFPLIFEPFV